MKDKVVGAMPKVSSREIYARENTRRQGKGGATIANSSQPGVWRH